MIVVFLNQGLNYILLLNDKEKATAADLGKKKNKASRITFSYNFFLHIIVFSLTYLTFTCNKIYQAKICLNHTSNTKTLFIPKHYLNNWLFVHRVYDKVGVDLGLVGCIHSLRAGNPGEMRTYKLDYSKGLSDIKAGVDISKNYLLHNYHKLLFYFMFSSLVCSKYFFIYLKLFILFVYFAFGIFLNSIFLIFLMLLYLLFIFLR